MPQIANLATVVDNHPRFMCEFVLWTICAEKYFSGRKQAYFIGFQSRNLDDFARQRGVEVRYADTLIPSSPHCNKLIPFLESDQEDNVFVADCDLFLSGDVGTFLRPDYVRLAPNNHASPPLTVFEKAFKAFGLSVLPEPGTALFVGAGNRETYIDNVSAGLISIPSQFRAVADSWLETAKWLSDNSSVLGGYTVHIDQISFSLTLAKMNFPFKHLPAQSNAILQLLPEIKSVYAFHLTSGHIPRYADWFNANKTLKWEEINPALESTIKGLNQSILEAVEVLSQFSETRDFVENFLNPGYRRS